jgi:hypothetical protein
MEHVVQIIDYLKFDYVVKYVIIEGEVSNTSNWFCCLSHDYFANSHLHGKSYEKN